MFLDRPKHDEARGHAVVGIRHTGTAAEQNFSRRLVLRGARTWRELVPFAAVLTAASVAVSLGSSVLMPEILAGNTARFGVMAVGMASAGVIAKLFSEAVETVDPKPVEGVRAVGATRVQEILFGVLPQVAPLWTSLALYRFESNVRSATVLGIVGAGGIGQSLLEEMRGFHYQETAAIVIVIIITVFATDALSSAIRKRMV